MTPPDHEVEKVNPQVRSPREAQGPVGPVGPVGPTDTGVGALGLAPSRVRRRRFAPRDRTYLAFHATASPDTKVSGRIFQRSMSSSDLGLFSDDDNAGLRSRRSHRDDDGEDGDDDDDEEEDDEDDRLSVKSDSLQWLQAGDTLPWNLPRHQRAKMRRPHESVLDPAERAVLRIADERDRVQKKTFTKWVNKHLMKARKHLNDLYEDLRDGHNLISLLEVLSNETLPRERDVMRSLRLVSGSACVCAEHDGNDAEKGPREKGRMRFHRLQNVQIALDYLKHRKIKLVNIRNDDITDGNPKLTLGLIWTIILHFQISDIQVTGQSEDMTAKEKLLLWSKRMVDGYPGVKCDNFTTSWRDGKLFTAIIHKHKPELVDLKQVHGRSNQENLEFAFSTAERELGVTRLLDPEDVDVASPDEKSIITYVSSLYDAIPKAPDGANANEVETQWREYQELVVLLLQWLRHHVTVMYTRNFPNNPAELKALYNQYLQFKEMELPPKENDKMRIKTLYKSLEAWILAGRIKLPQGQHPNDVEKEWGRLIVAMLEREKELRPEIERLEMLQRVALQIQQESGVCEEKLMRAERLLHMELRAGGSAGPGATELEVTLGELDALIRSMFANVQTLKDGRYFQAENMYRRVFQLHERVVALRSEHRTAFSPSRVAGSAVETQTSRATLETQTTQTDRGQGKLQQQQQQQLQVKLKQPQPQQRRSPGGSTAEEEATVSLRDLLQWVEAQQVALDAAEWGTDLPAVEANLEAHRGTHRDIEAFRARLEQAKAAEPKVSSANRGTYSEYLGRLELQYTRLLNSSRGRLRHLESLERFVSRATHELMWLNAREEEEVAHDWSNRNPDVASKREYHEELMKELEKKEVELNTLRDGGEQLLVQNHPARETIEAYLAAIQSQWHWILQICSCVETHLKENTTFFQFFAEAREGEQHLNSLLESIQRKYTCDKSSSLSRLEDLVQCSMDEKEQLVEFKRTVAGLVGRAKTIVQLKPRNPENRVSGSIPIRAVCDYKQMEITIHKGEECALEDNSQRSKWRVINPTGNIATVPSVCFLVPPPNPDAMETAARIEQLYQSAMALWHQQHVNMKSVVSYLYLIKDIEIIRSWNVITLKSLPQQEYERVVRSLQVRFQDFLEDSRESQLISTADHARVQADVEACRQHFDALLSAMRQEEEGESLCGSLLSRLQKLRLRLEGCEERVIRQIRAPLDPSDPLQDSVQRVAEQEAVVQDLGKVEAEMSSLDKESREALSAQPGQSHSVSSLASELALTTQKLVQVKALSTVYLERLKRMSMLVGSLQEADVLLKELEGHLYEEETVPTDPATVSTYIVQLQAWAKEAEETEGRKGGPLASLDVQLRAARESGGRMLSEHGERDPDLERVAERAEHTLERWQSARAQIRARLKELEGLAKVLRSYRESAVWLEAWLDKTMKLQEKVQASKIEDVRGLEEQLEKQKALAMDIEKNQVKVDECQKYSEQYSLAAKDYELQLMTYKAMVDTHQRSPVKRRRLLSTSDSIMQEYMTLRTRYTALVTMTSQYVKFISETLQRLQGEQQSLAESQEEHLTRSERLVGWVQAMHRSLGEKQRRDSGEGGAGGEEGKREPSDAAELERSLKEQQSFAEELSGRKEEIAEAIQRSQTFLALCGDKLTPEQYQAVDSQTQQLKQAYEALCEQSSAYTQELHHSLQQENSIKLNVESKQEEFSRRLDELESWLAEAKGALASQPVSGELPDIQRQQEKHQALQRELMGRGAEVTATVCAVRDFLRENGARLDPEYVARTHERLSALGSLHEAATRLSGEAQQRLNEALGDVIKQQTEKVATEEQLEDIRGKTGALLQWLTELESRQQRTKEEEGEEMDGTRSPEMGSVGLSELLHQAKAEHQEVLSRQQAVIVATQLCQALLERHASRLAPDDAAQLRRACDELGLRYDAALSRCGARLRPLESASDALAKLDGDCAEFEAWLTNARDVLATSFAGSGGGGEEEVVAEDEDVLAARLRRQREFAEDVVSRRGDLRYLGVAARRATEASASAGPEVAAVCGAVQRRLEGMEARYSTLHVECVQLGSRFSEALGLRAEFQRASAELSERLRAAEGRNAGQAAEPAASEPAGLQSQLDQATALQGDVSTLQPMLEKLKRSTSSLLEVGEDLGVNRPAIEQALDELTARADCLRASAAGRSEQLRRAVARSLGAREGLDAAARWLAEAEREAAARTPPGPLSSAAVRDEVAKNEAMQQELASHQGALATIAERLGDPASAAEEPPGGGVLREDLAAVTRRFSKLSTQCQERKEKLLRLTEKVEEFEEGAVSLQRAITKDSQAFEKEANGPNADLEQIAKLLEESAGELANRRKALEGLRDLLAGDLADPSPFADTGGLARTLSVLGESCEVLERALHAREENLASCRQQMEQFQCAIAEVQAWLEEAESRVPSEQTTLSTDALQEQLNSVQTVLTEWEGKASAVRGVVERASETARARSSVTPPAHDAAPTPDVVEVRREALAVEARYSDLGVRLRERSGRLSGALARTSWVLEEADALLAWLEERAQLTAAWGPVPAEPDAVRAEADKHKAFQEDLEDKAPRIQKVTQLLSELLESSADDPDADALRKRLDTIERGWSEVRAGAEERARRLEESCGLHETFSAALAQLSPWLAEKRLMASVLGPLALDPNMLTNQRQQVQFMLREFETRKPQHEQLNRVARGILGDDTDSAKDGGSGEVEEEDEESKALLREQLASVNAAWDGLTGELHDRAQRVEDAVRESGRLATALAQLAEGTAALARGLEEGQPPVAATPDALVVQLRRAEETMAAVAALAPVAEEARERSEKLGDVVGEAYLQAELRRRLDVALQPFKELEERASKRLELVQEALQCSRKFSESLEELATWVTEMRAELARFPPVSIEHGSVQAQLERQEEFLGRVTAREGSFQTIVADGEVVAQAPPGPSGAEDVASLGGRLAELKARWEELTTEATARRKAIHRCAKKVQRFEELREEIIRRLTESEERLGQVGQVTLSLEELESRLAQTQGLRQDVEKLQGPLELLTSAGRDLAESCPADADFVEGQTADIGRRVDSAMGEVQTKLEVTEAVTKRLKRFTRGIRTVQEKLAESRRLLEMHRSLGAQAASNGGHLEKMRACRDGLHTALTKEAEDLRAVARELAELAPGDAAGAAELAGQAERLTGELAKAAAAVAESCDALEERARGIGRLRGVARDLFARLSDLSEELDSQGPPGRAPEALRSQLADIDRAAAAAGQLGRDIADAGLECRRLLEQEEAEGKAGKAGEQPGAGEVEQSVELQGMRRETEALQRQCARLGERAAARKEEARTALERVEEFYRSLRQVTGLLERAEEKEAAQGPVGTEIDLINQQMADFQAFQKSDVDSLQVEMQALNRQAQALIQSAAKSADTGALESDADETNSRWNTLNTKVAERAAKLQEALLHCGKFQEALESLLGWLADTEELIAGQKPPAAEYKVVRAQLQEQKLLQHLLDDHRPRVEVLRREGEQIAELAEPAERERILGELASLSHRWEALLAAAQERQRQLEAILSVARRFHDTLEPLLDWLTAVERRLSNAEPIGTQTVAIQEQIDQHKCVAEDIASRAKPLEEAQELSSALMGLSCSEDGQRLQAKLGVAQARHAEAQLRSERRAALLNEALENARIFGENEVALLTWLAQTQDRLAALRNILDYRPEPLQAQYDEHLILHEEIVSRKQDVDQAIKNGHALLKQTTGDDVLLIQEKLDGLRGRYGEVSASGARAQRALEKALGLAVRFHAARDELGQWLDATEEAIAAYDRDEEAGGEQLTTLQGRQQDLRKQVMERRVLLDTVNEVGTALLALVPWRARDGLDTAVAQDNERYAAVSDAVATRTRRVDAAIQRSQQFEQALDAERAWAAETLRKLEALGDIRLEPEQTMSQLQVQKAFTIDILRHKDSLEMLEQTMVEVGASCSEEENGALQAKLALLRGEFEATSGANAERLERLERAHTLASQFWETLEELEPWLGETRAVLAALGPPAVDPDSLRQQQDELRHLRETIAEHKPHVERLRKTGPRLAELSAGEGGAVRDKQASCEQLYSAIRDDVLQRARALDEAVELSSQFHEKIEPMLEALERISERLRSPPPVPAETEKLRDHLSDNRAVATELDKLEPSFKALRARGEELIARSLALDAPPPDGARQRTASVSSEEGFAARGVQERMDRLVFLWGDIAVRAEEREGHLLDVLELSERFWYDHAALAATLRDAHDALRDLDDPALDPSLIKLQQEAMQALKEDSDGLQAELDTLGGVGCELMAACGDPDKPEVKKSIDELNSLWETVNRTWRERMERLDDAMQATIQFQDALQGMFDWLDMAEAKLAAMPPVGTDLESVKRQMEELKAFKAEAYGQQMEMERLTHQGELLLRRCEDPPQQEVLRSPLVELRRRWDSLDGKIVTRQHKLEASLLALGQFQHALSEVLTWLGHTEQLLAEQRTASGDPRHIEIELAKHHVLRNDVLAHKSTVESVSEAGGRLVRQADGEEASALRGRLGNLGRRWEAVLKHTDERQRQLEAALKQAQGFQGEVQGLMSWLARLDGQMAMARPPGGLPETAREQLNAHLELCREMEAREAPYYDLLERGRQLQDTGEEGAAPPPPSSCNGAQQGLRALQQRWDCVRAKLNDRKAKLEEAVSSATEFHNSLQEFIVWLTAAERAIGTATAPSLVLDTALFQVDEHKIFVTELNGRREALVELERAGAQLKLAAPKQDGALIRNLLLSVSARWDKVAQRSLERSRALEDARKRAKQFHESWSGLMGWLEEAERNLDTELDIANDPGKIKCQLSKHKEFQRALGGKQPSYDGTARGGRLMRERATQEDDKQRLDDMLSELRDRWDTVCGKSVERQNKLEEALLFSGQFADALQALVDWLYRVEPQLAEDQPVHGDLDLVLNLIDSHKVFQKELGKRSGGVAALRRSARDLAESSRDDATWVKVQMAELGARWDSVCRLSVTKQARLEVALKQAEEFHAAVHSLLEWLAEAEQTLRFHGTLPDDEEALCTLIETHKEFMKKLEERLAELNRATAMGEAILGLSHPDAVTTIKHWLTIIRARFEEVMAWAKQHQQRLETFLEELLQNAQLMDGLLSWLQRAEETLAGREAQPVPQDLDQVKTLIAEHQAFMEEMTQKQPDVDKLTKTFKRKQPTEAHSHIPTLDRTRGKKRVGMAGPSPGPTLGPSPLDAQNPRVNLLFNKWRQVWLMAWDRQRKLQDELDRLTELKEFASFDFDVWRKRYMRWMNHKKSRVMDFFRRIDKDQDGRITRQEFMEGILSSKFPTNRLEMSAVADVFDQDGDGCMDYYEFVAALHPNKDAYRPLTDADKIEDEVTRQVSKCRCPKRFQVEQIGDNKYRFFLGNQFGDSQQLRLVRILRSTVMVRVGGGWMALDEFLVKNDPCRVHHYGSRMIRSDIVGPVSSPAAIAKGRTNLELRERFILAEGVSQALAPFRPKGRRSRPDSRGASPTRSNSSPSNHSTSPANHQQQAGSAGGPGGSAPTSPPPHTASTTTRKSGATTTTSSNNNNHGETGSNTGRSTNGNKNTPVHSSRLKQPGFLTDSRKLQSSRPSSRTGSQAGSRPGSRQGSRAGSCTSSRRGSDASDLDVSDLTSLCSDASELQPQLRPQQQQQPHAGATAAGPGGLLRSSGSGSPVRPLRTGGRSSSAAALKPSKIPTPSKMKQPTPVRGGTAKR
ncbi:microtubule-actin cross-linking factor 1-like isoform X14 [Lethenteron reissneri]|uniref:microtubule-actin cross-linking factor 1-like isoform X14 n=1 Tax=Lethenteron reissneri TaxID=7753 RepID=UPI002AB743DC|nr:microtubule-actin cross-linking factor 1-like isoform X14 [Lethenteron reissneri]